MKQEDFEKQLASLMNLNLFSARDYWDIFTLCKKQRWNKDNAKSLYSALIFIVQNDETLKGPAYAEIAEGYKNLDKVKALEFQRLAVNVLREEIEKSPKDYYNYFYIALSYINNNGFIEFSEAFEAVKKAELLSHTNYADVIWLILKKDVEKVTEKELIHHLTKVLEKDINITPWNSYEERSLIQRMVKTPLLWIQALRSYTNNETIKKLFLELTIANNFLDEALSYFYGNFVNNGKDCCYNLLMIATIEDHLKIRPFIHSIAINCEKHPSGSLLAPLLISALFKEDKILVDIKNNNWKEIKNELVETIYCDRFDEELNEKLFFDNVKVWAITCKDNCKLYTIFKNITKFVVKYLANNECIEDFRLGSINNNVTPSFVEYTKCLIFTLIKNGESGKSVAQYILFLFGESDFSKYIIHSIRDYFLTVHNESTKINFLKDLIRNTPWYDPFYTKQIEGQYLKELDVVFSAIDEPESCKSIGQILFERNTTRSLAIQFFRRGAHSGCPCCMNYLGYAYFNGYGVKENQPLALHWFTLAWDRGYSIASLNIGLVFRDKFHDHFSAFPFFEKASHLDSYAGKLAYAKAKLDGLGCRKDVVEAVKIFNSLKEKKYEPAIKFIEERQLSNNSPDFSNIKLKSKCRNGQFDKTSKRRYICLDTETTGLSIYNDRVCEIAAIEYDPITFQLVSRFHVYLNPQRDMPYRAYKIHGLTDEFLRNKPLFVDVVNDFLNYIKGADLFIHNANYDIKMLNAELLRLGFNELQYYCKQIHCTLESAIELRGRGNNRLDDLCDDYGIDRSDRSKHGALLDCELLVQVIRAMQQRGFRF